MNVPRELSEEKCRALLTGGVFGRVAVCTPQGPHIVPVNYAVLDDAIFLRTAPQSLLGALESSTALAFEVDHVDYERQRGWSVVAVGPAEMLDDPDLLADIRRQWDPRPWAGGSRQQYIRVRWTSLTGRQIGAHWSAEQEMPVRRTGVLGWDLR